MPTHTQLKGVTSVYDSLLSDQIETNLYTFFQWGLLGVGAFNNVYLDQTSPFNSSADQSRLSPVRDPNYQNGQVWQGFRKDWVWETGVEYVAQPIRVSGVWVNDVFHSISETGAYAHKIDYPNGRVIFDNPVSTTSVVQAEYSYRWYQIYTADAEWWKKIQSRSFRMDSEHFLQWGSGDWNILAENRVQLPAVIIEAVPNVVSRTGFEIGNTVQTVNQDVLFHVLTEDRSHMLWLHDAITNQNHKRLKSFDKNLLFKNDAYPLDNFGSPRESGLMYPYLVEPTGNGGFGGRQFRFENATSTQQPMIGGIQYCTIRMRIGCEVP